MCDKTYVIYVHMLAFYMSLKILLMHRYGTYLVLVYCKKLGLEGLR